MSEVNLVATITPAEGKKDFVQEALIGLANAVQENEPEVLQYELLYNEETGEFVFFEKYKNAEVLERHKETEHYQAAQKSAVDQSALAKPPDVKILKKVGGFGKR